jgi:hypothetical protein
VIWTLTDFRAFWTSGARGRWRRAVSLLRAAPQLKRRARRRSSSLESNRRDLGVISDSPARGEPELMRTPEEPNRGVFPMVLRIWSAVNHSPRPDPRYCGVQGWLLVFVAYLTILYPLGLALTFPQWHATRTDATLSAVFPWAPWALFAERSFVILHGALGFYAGLSLWRIWPSAVPLAKFYVILFIGNAIAVAVFLWFFESQIGVAHRWPVLPSAEVVLGAICYLYLRTSKRVVSTYRSGP